MKIDPYNHEKKIQSVENAQMHDLKGKGKIKSTCIFYSDYFERVKEFYPFNIKSQNK